MRAPGAGVPPVSLRAEARPADLRRPVPHPKPGAHSHTVAAEKPVARLTVQVHLKPAHGASGRVAFPGHARGVDTVHPTDSPVEGGGFEPPVPLAETSRSLRRNGKCRRGEKSRLESGGPRVRIPVPPPASRVGTVEGSRLAHARAAATRVLAAGRIDPGG